MLSFVAGTVVMSVDDLIERVRQGDATAVARAISLVESGPRDVRDRVVAALGREAGRAFRIGVTGAPGVGKSTLLDRLAAAFRTRGLRLAIVAVDPTSPYSHGAVLGDRIRMQGHAADAGVFVRSMATRGRLGGLSDATHDAVRIFEAAGFDVVIIETVGVGQGEVGVVDIADVAVVVLAPGAGDDTQALKAGVLEIADIIVVNKADQPGADAVAAAIRATVDLDERADRAWAPDVISTAAATGQGVQDLAGVLERLREAWSARGARRDRRRVVRERPETAASIDHVGIAVDGDSPFLGWLGDVFGLRPGPAEDVASAGARVRFIDTGGARLELVEPLASDSPVARFIQRRGAGLHHVAIRVARLDDVLEQLRARGVRLVDDTPRQGAHGTRIAFVHPSSAGGVLVELVERLEE